MGTGGEAVEESAGAGVTGGAGRIALTASPCAHADAVADKVGSVPHATPVLSGAAGRRVGRSAGGCRGCHCKNSRCLKLYCDCFAAGVYCTDCYCANCLNRPEYENARQRAIRTTLLRNPLAFHAKVVLGDADGGENDRAVVRDRLPSAMAAPPGTGPPEHLVTSAAGGDGPAAEASSPPTPPLDRTMSAVATPDGRLVPMLVSRRGQHIKGCSCRRSACLKKYCECFENRVVCSDACRCVNCKNYDGSEELVAARERLALAEMGISFSHQRGASGTPTKSSLSGILGGTAAVAIETPHPGGAVPTGEPASPALQSRVRTPTSRKRRGRDSPADDRSPVKTFRWGVASASLAPSPPGPMSASGAPMPAEEATPRSGNTDVASAKRALPIGRPSLPCATTVAGEEIGAISWPTDRHDLRCYEPRPIGEAEDFLRRRSRPARPGTAMPGYYPVGAAGTPPMPNAVGYSNYTSAMSSLMSPAQAAAARAAYTSRSWPTALGADPRTPAPVMRPTAQRPAGVRGSPAPHGAWALERTAARPPPAHPKATSCRPDDGPPSDACSTSPAAGSTGSRSPRTAASKPPPASSSSSLRSLPSVLADAQTASLRTPKMLLTRATNDEQEAADALRHLRSRSRS
ncbi:hypothetical protein CDCA_CDCA18G4546 [Cyanidium caldarium]|uniref:CRC domain-containing protein n=1 Tax=Cyanidium caldarium TaxID=2771 RepID=A0AAV9J2B4_CYACA|nr:hypothetical protein CDCA_CDCA18G4546 [Cyanidium caldarium]